MSITGHKSLNNLSIYQKVSTDGKLCIVYAMSCYLHSERSTPLKIGPKPIEMSKFSETRQQENHKQIAFQVPAWKQDTVCHMPSATVTSTSVQNEQNPTVQYENKNPFSYADIPDFDLG